MNYKSTDNLEIFVHSWVKTDEWIFRSWTGRRRVNGEEYHGAVYCLGSDKLADKEQKRVCNCQICNP